MKHIFRLLVLSADDPIMAEVARLGVAMGYEVIAVVPDIPAHDEPWRHGVDWRVEIPTLSVDATVGWAEDVFGEGRSVILAMSDAQVPQIGQDSVVLAADFNGLPIEQSAMAALRAAVETERSGTLTHAEVAHLGDAMMLQ